MRQGETVTTGAYHPGTPLQVLSSPAGFYLGYVDKDGYPYSRETHYMTMGEAVEILKKFRGSAMDSSNDSVRVNDGNETEGKERA